MLIDVFIEQGKLYAWIGKKIKLCDFKPRIFAYSSKFFLKRVKDLLEKNSICSRFEFRKTLKGWKTVLGFDLPLNDFHRTIYKIKQSCNYSVELFNSDIPLEEYFLADNKVMPTSEVKYINSRILPSNENIYQDFEMPKLRTAYLSIIGSVRKKNSSIDKVEFNREIFEGESLVSDFVKAYKKFDCDILISPDIDIVLLLEKIRQNLPDFSFSRVGRDEFKSKGGSFHSYGQVLYKDPPVYLKGRLHLAKHPVLYGSWTEELPFILSRICRVPVQKINHRSVGYGVASLQIYNALNKGYLIPNNSVCVERWKSGMDLFNADRGPLTYDPLMGYHDNIAEIDFVSLFPSIMVKYNISTETLFCKCCDFYVPGLNIKICQKQKGVMAEILGPMIKQRQIWKKEGKVQKANALKGLLVTSFGYMGFKKSRFARIESHQAIQAYAREILLAASHISEDLGFQVVHGIVDSLWVKKKNITKEEVNRLIFLIKEKLGFEAKMEGVYRWIVFLPSTSNSEVPVATRYFGVFSDGEVKVRGIALRRHDTPKIIKKLQRDMINVLADCKDYEEFNSCIVKCLKLRDDLIKRLKSNGVDSSELKIVKRISKTNYKVSCAQSLIIDQLVKDGYEPEAGQYIRYLIRNKNSKFTLERYGHGRRYDVAAYIDLVRRSFDELFSQFNKKITINDYQRSKAMEMEVKARIV
jgi:DNA polymerase elongation subunit (family B)